MELLMVKQRKATMEQQMQLYEIIKGKRDLLKEKFQNKEDAKYWALKKEVNNLKLFYETKKVSNDRYRYKRRKFFKSRRSFKLLFISMMKL